MPLLALPNELLSFIIQETVPEGFESLMLTCKIFYGLGKGLISEHHELKRNYTRVEYPRLIDPQGRKDGVNSSPLGLSRVSSIELLEDIIREPLIARYFRDVNLIHDRIDNGPEMKAFRADTQLKNGLLSLLESSTYLRLANQDPQTWLDAILGGFSYVYATTFLLTLLPNVETLSLPARWNYLNDLGPAADSVWNVLDIITQRANEDIKGTASLAHLSTLGPATNLGHENRHFMQDMAPFLSIRSVRNFHGVHLVVGPIFHKSPFTPRYSNFALGLEYVDLSGCYFGIDEFLDFIKPVSRLKAFRFSCENTYRDLKVEAGAIITALIAAASETLESLIVYSNNDRGTKSVTGVTDLTGFKRLKNLTLGISWLSRRPLSHLAIAGHHDLLLPNPTAPRLIDILPPSIARLQLLTGRDRKSLDCLQTLLTDYVAEKAAILPTLASVEIHGFGRWSNGKTWPQAVLRAQEEANVEVVDKGNSEYITTELDDRGYEGVWKPISN